MPGVEEKSIQLNQGKLIPVTRDEWPFWELKGAAPIGELIDQLPAVEPIDDQNRQRAHSVYMHMFEDMRNLFDQGGMMDGSGVLLDTGDLNLSKVRPLSSIVAQKGVARFTVQNLAKMDVVIEEQQALKFAPIRDGVVYAIAPGLGQRLVPFVDDRGNLFYRAPRIPNFNADALTRFKRVILPRYVIKQEEIYGVKAIYTAPSLARAGIYSTVTSKSRLQSIARG